MAVAADDQIQTGDVRRHVGVDVVVDLDAARVLGEADVGQGQDHIVGRAQLVGQLLGLCRSGW